jgi:hypothetical protein
MISASLTEILLAVLRAHGQPMTTTELRQHANRTTSPGGGYAVEAQDIYRALLILKQRGKVRHFRFGTRAAGAVVTDRRTRRKRS